MTVNSLKQEPNMMLPCFMELLSIKSKQYNPNSQKWNDDHHRALKYHVYNAHFAVCDVKEECGWRSMIHHLYDPSFLILLLNIVVKHFFYHDISVFFRQVKLV